MEQLSSNQQNIPPAQQQTPPAQQDTPLILEFFLLYVLITIVLITFLGILPSDLGAYPPAIRSSIMNCASNLTAIFSFLAVLFTFGRVQRAWKKMRVLGYALTLSIVTVLLGGSIIGANVYQMYRQEQRVAQANATVTAVARATSQANATATAVAKATSQANATATAVANNNATATAVAVASRYPFGNTFLLRDFFPGYRGPNAWDVNSDNTGSCSFMTFAYVVKATQSSVRSCFAEANLFENFTYEIQLRILPGGCGGISFSNGSNNSDFKVFMICQNGNYIIGNVEGKSFTQVIDTLSNYINSGIRVINTIAGVSDDGRFTLYVNAEQVDSIADSDYSQGHIGVVTYSEQSPAEAIFFHAKVWKLINPQITTYTTVPLPRRGNYLPQ